MKRRAIRTAIAIAILAGLVGGALAFARARPLSVSVAQVERDVPITVFGLGTIEARILSDIGFETGAALAELDADQGDMVEKGQVLARLQSGEQKARLARAEAGIATAQAAATKAEAAISRARAVLVQKRAVNARKHALLARNAVSVEFAEESQMEEDVAVADLALARSEVDVARAALADAKAARDYERVLLDHHVLRAPYDALVVARHKELGVVLGPGAPLFTLVAPDTVWARAYVDEARAGDIRLGQKAEIRLRSAPRALFAGHVTRIDIESDRVSEERRVYIACDACPAGFHLGEQAEAFITTTVLEAALLVPQNAVEGFDGAHGQVWIVMDGALHRRKVEFGRRTLDARLELVAGLPDGAQVLAALPDGLREGRAARIVDDGDTGKGGAGS